MTIAFNIGYRINDLGSGIFTYSPIQYETSEIREFTAFIRDNASKIMEYADANLVPKSSICLWVVIVDEIAEWSFMVKMKNVREYNSLLHSDKNPERSVASKAQ